MPDDAHRPSASRSDADASAHRTSHVFLSYARRDNERPVNAEGQGWVAAFKAEIEARHRRYSSRELHVFFDQKAIDVGGDWRRRLGEGIRTSRLFLAFLSPRYLESENCLWEWDEYLRREHSMARGDDGITPIFFVTPGDLTASKDARLERWLADLNRRNRTLHCELHPWFDGGPEILKQLDAASRAAEIKTAGRDPSSDVRTLGERLDALDRRIAARLDRIALADLAPGNIARSHEHFVGRHRELSELHTIMLTGGEATGGRGSGGRGMIAAAHSPGGLGKTALARQYAHAYAEFYAAGGTWEMSCEGTVELGAALLRLAEDPRFVRAGAEIGKPLELGESLRQDYRLAAAGVLDYLRTLTHARVEVLRAELAAHPERHSPEAELPVIEQPRALLILDNVDQPELLRADQIAMLPAEDWLEVIVTTRLDPERFGGGDRVFHALEVDVLPAGDALQLLRDFQPGRRFADDAEDTDAAEIVRILGGYTLAIELVGAHLGDLARQGYHAGDFLKRLRGGEGFELVDDLAGKPDVAAAIRHGGDREKAERILQNQIGTLVGWSLERLTAPARSALELASLLMPDEIPLSWLQDMVCARHPEVAAAEPDAPHHWAAIWRELYGLRLLHAAREIERDERGMARIPVVVRIHRLVAGHVVAKTPSPEESFAELDQYLDALTTRFEQDQGEGTDAWRRVQHPWLREQMEHLIAAGGMAGRLTASLLTSAGVVARYEGTHGSLARALDLRSRVLAVQEEIRLADPRSAQAARDVSVSLSETGSLYLSRGQAGDAEKALACFDHSLEIRQTLRSDNPGSAQAARDVSLSLDRLGDFYISRGQAGDAEKALACFDHSLEIGQTLRSDNPGSAQAARDVSLSLDRLGDFYISRGQAGDAEKALACFDHSLEIRQTLRSDNPGSAQAARDVSLSLDRLGDFYISRGQAGDAEKALACFDQSLEIGQTLRSDNPGSAQAARDVSLSLDRLGDFYISRGQAGDAEKALACFEQSLEIAQKLRSDNPGSAQAARDVLVALERIANVHAAGGDAPAALRTQEQSLLIARELFGPSGGSWSIGRTLVISLLRTGQMAGRAAAKAPAAALLGECYALLHAFHEAGTALDPEMRGLHEQLHVILGSDR